MSGGEAMQQGAPDPFFAEQRRMTESDIVDEAAKNGEYDAPQILGSGNDDFRQCDDCSWDICAQAKSCLRQKART